MEENRKGQTTLFLVVSVMTLIVAIVGATFAYFSASVNADENSDAIQGETENLTGALTLNVKRVVFEGVDANVSDNLVPTDITATAASINDAVDSKCVANGYTGCHLYKITATSSKTLQNVSVNLKSLTISAVDTDSWKYVIYSNDGTDNLVEVVDTDDSIVAASDFATFTSTYMGNDGEGNPKKPFDMHNNSSIETATPVYYYLMIYLENKNAVQNPTGEGADTNEDNGTGNYTGQISMEALGGQVVASFSAAG